MKKRYPKYRASQEYSAPCVFCSKRITDRSQSEIGWWRRDSLENREVHARSKCWLPENAEKRRLEALRLTHVGQATLFPTLGV